MPTSRATVVQPEPFEFGEGEHPVLGVARVGAPAGQHVVQVAVGRQGLDDRPADGLLGQDRGRGHGDGAAEGVVGDVLQHRLGALADHVHPQADLVAAGGVDVVDLDVVGLPQADVLGVPGVVEDELAVQVHQAAPVRKIVGTRSRASVQASISSGVV